MNILLPIHKKYSDLIFSGKKPFEFRNTRMKLSHGDRAYVYETKNGGCGMVVGHFTIDNMDSIPYHRVATYWGLPHYVERYGSDEDRVAVDRAMKIRVDGYDDCIVLDDIYDDDCLEYMEKHGEPMSGFLKWSDTDATKYRMENQQKRATLFSGCDEWLAEMGYYNQGDESTWKWYIAIIEPVKYDTPLSLDNFMLMNGKPIRKAPQSFCYVQ